MRTPGARHAAPQTVVVLIRVALHQLLLLDRSNAIIKSLCGPGLLQAVFLAGHVHAARAC